MVCLIAFWNNRKGVISLQREQGLPRWHSGKEPTDARDVSSIPGWGRSPVAGNGNLLQYSCPGNPVERGARQATVHRVAKSQT